MVRTGVIMLLAALAAAPALAQTATPVSGPWRETFDTLDAAVWETQLYSFPANGCNMTAGQAAASSGKLVLSLAMNAAPTKDVPKLCNAGEVGSYRFFTYGLFTVRMKAPAVPGGVSAFFLMNAWQPENWEHKEIDIELLGKNPDAIQMTTHDFQNGGRDWKSAATTADLGFDYSHGFHDYAILWTPEAVRWYVDGKLLHTEARYVPHDLLQIRMNTYLGDPKTAGIADWLGPLDATKVPAKAEYGEIDYYPLDALPKDFKIDGKP